MESYYKNECIVAVNIKVDSYYEYVGINIKLIINFGYKDSDLKINDYKFISLDDTIDEIKVDY